MRCTNSYTIPASVENWIANPPEAKHKDPLSVERFADLYISLPTRDGTNKPYVAPTAGAPIPYGHHLAFFHARRPETLLRADGTDEDISPPSPFTKRMWASGKVIWNINNPLLMGKPGIATSSIVSTTKKGFDQGKPMLFITQRLDFKQEGNVFPSIIEERAHVYFDADVFAKREKVLNREVKDIPTSSDFSFTYTPTPVILFRYSALMFNAHHIHLDKEYCQKVEGYPERVVHGPLTAQMLLETLLFNVPEVQLKQFEYRATNPLFVNQELMIHGKWLDKSHVKLWCMDKASGVVGMTGNVVVDL
ncbi:hypothetical protein BJ165DRAFT_1400347 [Panaeolus papilionaceus]|nr:hypothetical protein BJ165DRAFT_1400347 [Panaeolus papilionaceus]